MRVEQIEGFELHNADCLDVMRGMASGSVDAIVTDPPYFRVKGEDWDNQWDDANHFIEWVGLSAAMRSAGGGRKLNVRRENELPKHIRPSALSEQARPRQASGKSSRKNKVYWQRL